MFDFKPFMENFATLAAKFGSKMATVLTIDCLVLAFPVMENPTEMVAIAKLACIAAITITGLTFRFKQDKLKNGETQ